jgi:O-antigen/teichoic acid export membrane protein
VMLAVQRTHSLVVMAAIVGGTNLAAGVLQYVLARRLLPTMQVSFQRMTKVYLQSLAKFCAGMGVMQFGMFLVSGLDLTIVGYFSFSEVGYYALASNALMLMTASANAAQGALVAPIASIHARGEEQRLASVVLKATYYLALLLTLLSILFIALGMTGLKLWVGPVYAHATVMILYVLVLGNALRLLILPYNAAVVAVGQHVRVAFTPVAEGVLNLVVSVVAGWYLGAIGVAIGTLVGSAGGVAMCLFYVVPRITDVKVTAGELIRACTLPMAYFLPTVGAIYLYQHEHAQVISAYTALLCAGVGLTALMFIRRFRGDTIAA